MLSLLIAAALAAPTPKGVENWFTYGDVPPGDVNAKGLTLISYGVTVSPDGVAQTCRVETSSGNLTTDKHVCGVILKRARFTPARDANGNAAYGIYRDAVHWWDNVDDPPSESPRWDLDVAVQDLPAKTRSPAYVEIMFQVDPTGRPSKCVSASSAKLQELADIACRQVLTKMSPMPAADPSGTPVASVQNAVVRFRER